MNILVLSGGTGSIALQTGLFDQLDKKRDGFNTKILCNAYDNGKSTGDVRKVMNGKILGPSDVRKNQTTRLKLEKPSSPWNKFLDIRFTGETDKAKQLCLSFTDELRKEMQVGSSHADILTIEEAINSFFDEPSATRIDYSDFSLANIVYAGLARKNGHSLRAAARIMAGLMGIGDNVILNDDTSLFLGAITKSGVRVTDEGDIVSWGKVDDPFVDLFFVDSGGNETLPVLCAEAITAIKEADLIILSSGTQWSSLIPTYASIGFKEAIESSSAKIIMVMNRQPDKDSPGQTASDIVELLIPRYFSPKRLSVVIDSGGHPQMSHLSKHASSLLLKSDITPFVKNENSKTNETVHNPYSLVNRIFNCYFSDYLDSESFMFDYDDTLVGRGNYQPASSKLNKELIAKLNSFSKVFICTGNSIKAVFLHTDNHQSYIQSYIGGEFIEPRPLSIYADGGVNLYTYSQVKPTNNDDGFRAEFARCINPECKLGTAETIQRLIYELLSYGIPYSKIENRGDVMISIKPIQAEYQNITLNLIRFIFQDTGFVARLAGRTTIEICKPLLTKQDAVKHVLDSGVKSITFVGDEMASGNDSVVPKLNDDRVRCLSIKDPAETSLFLSTLINNYYE